MVHSWPQFLGLTARLQVSLLQEYDTWADRMFEKRAEGLPNANCNACLFERLQRSRAVELIIPADRDNINRIVRCARQEDSVARNAMRGASPCRHTERRIVEEYV